MKTKTTKRKALKIVENKFGRLTNEGHNRIYGLCSTMPPKLQEDWCVYWEEINSRSHAFISCAISYDLKDRGIVASLARLMITFHFIEDTYR